MIFLLTGLSCLAGCLFLASLLLRRETTAAGEPARLVAGALAFALAAAAWESWPFLVPPLILAAAWLMGWLDPLLLRIMPGSAPTPAAPRAGETIKTEFLEAVIDSETGAISGTVTRGIFSGRALSDLRALDVALVWHDCRFVDQRSADLIERYLDRIHPTWREDVARGEREMRDTEGRMQPQQAHEILGLAPPATEEEIRRAHRDLMLKLHPDRGGSTYLSAQVNEAKDVLLASLGRS